MKTLVVGELMSSPVVTVWPDESLATVRKKMSERRIRHVPVVHARRGLVGLVSHRDLLRNTLMERPGMSSYVEDSILETLEASQVMTTELAVVDPNCEVREAARLMLDRKIGCLPVVKGREVVGILTEADFLRAFLPAESGFESQTPAPMGGENG